MSTSIAFALKTAQAALQRGDYMQCLDFLEELSNQYPLSSQEGAKIRMLMVTAWMGQGEDQKAISTCRLLSNIKEPSIRQEAKQLLSILEAPTLPRPESWSIKIPNIDIKTKTGVNHYGLKKKAQNTTQLYPPTGPTRAFDRGFSTLIIVILITLTIFLSN